MIIDTHVHVWDLNKAEYPWLKGDASLLNQTWKIQQIEEERKRAGVTAGILVQAASNVEDTDNMLQVAETTEWIKGVVVWLPLQQPAMVEKLLEKKYLDHPYFKGVRHQIHDEPDTKWLLQPKVIESLKLLAEHKIPYDVVAVLPGHIKTVLAVSEKVPDLRMVFDHLAQPPIATKERFGEWGQLMKQAAEHKNFYAKISGIGTTAKNGDRWKSSDLEPYIEFVIKHFGVNRCFCGGDWPVALLAGSYSRIWKAYNEIIERITNREDRERVLSGNAEKFYDI